MQQEGTGGGKALAGRMLRMDAATMDILTELYARATQRERERERDLDAALVLADMSVHASSMEWKHALKLCNLTPALRRATKNSHFSAARRLSWSASEAGAPASPAGLAACS